MTERKDVTTPILKALTQLGIMAHRINSGTVKARGGWVKLAPEGTADIVVYPRDRRPLWIETKLKGEKLSPKQEEFANRVESLGHTYWVITSLADLEPHLEGLR